MAGGLGNQLFQLYAGLDYATKTNRKLVLNYSQFQKGYTKREEKISDDILRSINYDVTISTDKTFIKARIIVDRLSIRMMRIVGAQKFFKRGRTSEIGYSSNFRYMRVTRLSGYFQTWRHYLYLSEQNYLNEIKLINPSNNFKHWESKIVSEKPVIIHIRRGYYLSLSENWGLLGFEYFREAVFSLVGQNTSHKLLVFSDEPLKAEQLLQKCLFANVEYFPTGTLANDFEELLLMGKSDKIVISNSTFSWWAAQLGQTKHVAAPDKWFRGMDDPIDLIPNSWKRIRSSWESVNKISAEKIDDVVNVQPRVKRSN